MLRPTGAQHRSRVRRGLCGIASLKPEGHGMPCPSGVARHETALAW